MTDTRDDASFTAHSVPWSATTSLSSPNKTSILSPVSTTNQVLSKSKLELAREEAMNEAQKLQESTLRNISAGASGKAKRSVKGDEISPPSNRKSK